MVNKTKGWTFSTNPILYSRIVACIYWATATVLLMPLLSRERAMTTPKTFAQFHYFIVLSLLLPFFAFSFQNTLLPPLTSPKLLSLLILLCDYKRDQPLDRKEWVWCGKFISLPPSPISLSTLAFIFAKNAKKKRKIYGKYGKSATQI